MVGAAGFEPATSCSQSRRAARLRYAPTSPELLIFVQLMVWFASIFSAAEKPGHGDLTCF